MSSISTLDLLLIEKHKQMIGLNNITCDANNNTSILGNLTILSNLYVTNNFVGNNGLSSNSFINISGNTVIENGCSLLSDINVLGSGIINNSNISNNLYVSNNTIFVNNLTLMSDIVIPLNMGIDNSLTSNNINLLGNIIVQNNCTTNNLFINGTTTMLNNSTINSYLIISGSSNIKNLNITSLNILGNTTILGNATLLSLVQNTGNTIINNNLTITLDLNTPTLITNTLTNNNDFIINNDGVIIGGLSVNSNLTISGYTILKSSIINNNLNVSNTSIINSLQTNNLNINNNGIFNNNINVSGNVYVNNNIINNSICTFNNNVTINSLLNVTNLNINQLNILGQITSKLPNYMSNLDAATNGVPLWGLYRTGGMVKIRLDINPIHIELIGLNTILTYLNNSYVDPGIIAVPTINIYSDEVITTYITSIVGSDLGQILNTPILISNSQITISTTIMDTSIPRNYIITYTSSSNYNVTSNIIRNVNILSIPTITNFVLSSNQNTITFNINGIYSYSTYFIKLNSTNIVNETIFINNSIDTSNLISNINYILTINLKALDNSLITNNTFTFTIDKLPPVLGISNPYVIAMNGVFNIFTSVNAYDPPSNNPIVLNASNIVSIIDMNNNIIPIPSDGLLNTSVYNIFYITYTMTDEIGNNKITTLGLTISPLTISAYGFRDFADPTLNYSNGGGNISFPNNLNIFSKFKDSVGWTIEFWLYTMGPFGVWPFKSSYSPTDIKYVGPDPGFNIPTTTVAFGNGDGLGPVSIFSISDIENKLSIMMERKVYYHNTTGIYVSWGNSVYSNIQLIFVYPDITSFQYNNWEHFVIQYDGTNISVFIDGHKLLLNYYNNGAPPNTKLGTNTIPFKDQITFGSKDYGSRRDFYPGYISQFKISNCVRYTGTNFIPSRNIYTIDSNTIFLLGDNYTDVISNIAGNISNINNPLAPYIIPRNLIDIYSSSLIYQFPGGRLSNNYWCCHNNSLGASWSNMINFSSLYNPNQNFSNGMSIAVNLYINSTNVGIFYYGSDPSNLSNSLYIKYTNLDFSVTCNGVTSSMGVIGDRCSSGHNNIRNDGSNAYSQLVNKSRMLFIFYPNGYMHLWIDQYRFTPELGVNVGFNNNFNKTGLWLGALNESNFTGVISNLRIYNKPMNWDQVYGI